MGISDVIDSVNQGFASFIGFVGGKLQNFPNLTLGEQISYPAIGLGLVLLLTSIVLFII